MRVLVIWFVVSVVVSCFVGAAIALRSSRRARARIARASALAAEARRAGADLVPESQRRCEHPSFYWEQCDHCGEYGDDERRVRPPLVIRW